MANVLKLKEKARALELKSQWRPALEVYQRLADEDGEDIGIWNRIGDLHLRLGEAHRAVEAYERGVDAYADAGLLNNAIALCNKILRTAPERTVVYRKLATFTASQGFLADARAYFLKFAERMGRLGHHEEALDALREAVRHLPEDVQLRRMLAEQLHSLGHTEEAVEQLRGLLAWLGAESEEADAVRAQLSAIDPRALETTIPMPAPPSAEPPRISDRGEERRPAGAARREPEPQADVPDAELGVERNTVFEGYDLPDLGSIEGFERVQQEEDADSVPPLPLMELQLESLQPEGEESDAGPAEPLRTLSLEDWSRGAGGGSHWDELPDTPDQAPEQASAADASGASRGDALERLRARVAIAPDDHAGNVALVRTLREQGRSGEAEALLEARHTALAEAHRYAEAAATVRTLLELREEDTALYQQQVEYAFRAGEREPLVQAYLDLAHHLTGAASAAKAHVVYERVIELDPDNEEARRALTPAPPPSQPSRAESHLERGLAFKEQGMLDEAIAELQAALREGSRALPTLEALGECFHAKGQFSLAARVLERALRESETAEEEQVGVHYWIARSQESLGETRSARQHYERVLAFDVLHRDARARLAALPEGGESHPK